MLWHRHNSASPLLRPTARRRATPREETSLTPDELPVGQLVVVDHGVLVTVAD